MKKNSTTSQSIQKILGKGLLLNLVSNILLYIGHLIIARQLPREDYATFVVVGSLVSLAALFADLGLTGLFIRKFAEAEVWAATSKKDIRGELLGSIFGLRIGLAVIISIVVLLITPRLGYPLETRHLIMIMLVTFFISSRLVVVRSVGDAFLRGANKYHIVAYLTAVDALVFTSLLLYFSGRTLSLESAVWIYSFCHLPGFFLLAAYIYRDLKSINFQLQFRFRVIRSMFRESLPFILATAFLTIHSQVDPLFLDRLSSSTEVSAFGAALRVLSAIIFLPAVFSAVIGPLVTQATVTRDFDKIRLTLDSMLRILLTCALFGAIILSVSSDLVMSLLFGAGKYSDAAPLVIIFGWMFIPICFSAFIMDIAIAEGKSWIPVLFTTVILIISIICNVLLIPQYGAFGSALAKGISLSIGSITLLFATETLEVFDRKKITKLFLKLSVVALYSLSSMYVLSLLKVQGIFAGLITISTSFIIAFVFLKIISFKEIRVFIFGFSENTKISKI